jgi:protein-tyrosine-phosphatase
MDGPAPLYRVLFVCAGNTCRSPLAAAALRQALGEAGRRVAIASAGVAATAGAAATAPAVATGQRHGVDLGGHRAQRVGAELLEQSDLVLALDTAELEAVRRLLPGAASRIHLITELGADAPSRGGVPDPFGGSPEVYEECWRRIAEHVARIAPIVVGAVQARAEAEAGPRHRGNT